MVNTFMDTAYAFAEIKRLTGIDFGQSARMEIDRLSQEWRAQKDKDSEVSGIRRIDEIGAERRR